LTRCWWAPPASHRALDQLWAACIATRYAAPRSRRSWRRWAGWQVDHLAVAPEEPVEKYDEAIVRLDAAGAAAPPGRSYHVALEADGKINVFDVWESQEAFDAFGATLMPILSELGVDPGAPMAMPVHNVIVG
jgi:hypothetical protein